jgi:hypothetical protein
MQDSGLDPGFGIRLVRLCQIAESVHVSRVI